MKLTATSVLATLTFACTPAMAQSLPANSDTGTGAEAGEETGLIIVTGTRERSRTQFDTLAPVDVLSA
ncbi:hypothetical protein INQ16_29560, partial [Escherichia coli]|nr:hypothetical protein [Escherichia coli]